MRARALGCVVLLAFAPPVASRTVEEWQVSVARRIIGHWRVAEVKFFSDAACSKELLATNESSFSGHPVTEKVPWWRPVQNGGKDCVEHCDGKSGYCNWCGEGNACCRKNFKGDPKECHAAEGFTTSTQHECVSVPGEKLQTRGGGDKATDGHMSTSYQADCGHDGCNPGALMLGGGLVQETAQINCIALEQRREDAVSGSAVQAALLRRPPLPAAAHCPGACRSGKHLEGSMDGICQEYISQHGACGSTKEHIDEGWDCRGCIHMEAATPRTVLRVASRETFENGQVVVTRLKAASIFSRSGQEPVDHVGEDCWGPCISGYCSWCGEGHACCKSGGDSDLPECADATGFVALSHHECVALLKANAGVMDGPFPPWLVSTALVAPWVTIGFGMLCYACRGWACCGICRKGSRSRQADFKPLSGEVYARRTASNGDDELRKKVLREQAKKLDWLT